MATQIDVLAAVKNALEFIQAQNISGGDVHDDLVAAQERLEKRGVMVTDTYSGLEMAGAVEKLVNIMGNGDEIEKFTAKMAGNHPTLQQAFMRLCLDFIRAMAEKTYSDARNEASVRIAKDITAQLGSTYLPTI
jgi:hypothetical protein